LKNQNLQIGIKKSEFTNQNF